MTVLTGVLRDKDYHRMYAPLLPYAAQFITVTPDSPRPCRPRSWRHISRRWASLLPPAIPWRRAAALALAKAANGGAVLCCGSLYLMGEAEAALLR